MIKIPFNPGFSDGGTGGTREKRYEMVIRKCSLQGVRIYIYVHVDKGNPNRYMLVLNIHYIHMYIANIFT